MAAIQNFRRSISGFNREDVVQYIDYINKKHAMQVNQLKSELQDQKEELELLRAKPNVAPELESRLEAAESERDELQQQVAALQAEVAGLKAQLEQPQVQQPASSELEAYRRAERFERLAGERVAQMYSQANAALERATAGVVDTASQVGQITDSVAAQLAQMQDILAQSKLTMQGTADAMKAIRPIDPEQ